MAKIKVKNHRLRASTLETIATANVIIKEYSDQGLDITLRQLYYQLVARGLIPNEQKQYDRLGLAIRKAREAGLVDWYALVDRTRYLRGYTSWDDPQQILRGVAHQYALDMWETQKNIVEVWVEKDALIGVIGQACDSLFTPHFSCRGYTSASELFIAARRLKRYQKEGKYPIVLHLGDHDPSGIDMSRDIFERLELYGAGIGTNEMPDSPTDYKEGRLNLGADFTLKRIALNMPQVHQYNPPPFWAKLTDSRSHGPNGYIANYGQESWELDALPPTALRDLIQEHIELVKDQDAWDKTHEAQELDREKLTQIKDNYNKINFGFTLQRYTCPSCDDTGRIPGGYEYFECDYCGVALMYDSDGDVVEPYYEVNEQLRWRGDWVCPHCEHDNRTRNSDRKGTCEGCEKVFWLGPVDAAGDRAAYHEVAGDDKDDIDD